MSPGGSDTNDGCSSAAPRATVAAAVMRAAQSEAVGVPSEVRACAGTYAVNGYTLSLPVSISGGYSCTSWARDPAYGFPTFSSTNVTVFTTTTATDTFTINPAMAGTIGGGVVIDGIDFEGASGTVNASSELAALTITGGASPTISNCVLNGGAVQNTGGAASAGLSVYTAKSAPLITKNKISGGSGVSTSGSSSGSIGVHVRNSATPHIVGNVINGGSGTSTVAGRGSTGIALTSAGSLVSPLALEGKDIDGGTGTGPLGIAGVFVSNVPGLDFLDNDVRGGTLTGMVAAGARVVGVTIQGAGTTSFHLWRNRIYGGESTAPAAHVGIALASNAGPVEIVNDEVHSGGVNGSSLADTGSAALAIDGTVGKVTVLQTTFMVAPSNATWAGVRLFAGTAANDTFDDNLFLGAGSSSAGIVMVGCNNMGAISDLRGNAFVNVAGHLVDDGCIGGAYDKVAALESGMTGAKAHFTPLLVSGNKVVRNVADAMDPGAIVVSECTTVVDCAQALLLNYGSDSGATGMFTTGPKGGRLGVLFPTTAPCALLNAAYDDTLNAPADLTKNKRTVPPTPGAFEVDGPACCAALGASCVLAADCCSGACMGNVCK
jgi:hypothetical protein